MKKFLPFIAIFLLTACTPDESLFKTQIPVSRPSIEDRIQAESEIKAEKPLPEEVNLDVPFYPQAPDADWNMPWQEACEEASIVLAYYYAMDKDLSKEKFKEHILEMVDWQENNHGSYIHSTVEQMMEIFQDYFGFYNLTIVEDPTIDDMKKELAKGNVIVAPFAGQMLGNPFYSGEGPYYHVMVIKGYDKENFIVNDVGTRRGEDFLYSYKTIMDTLHDYIPWGIENADSRIILVQPL